MNYASISYPPTYVPTWQVLVLDASNIESIACLGAHFFYAEQPEISIRYYRR